MRLLVVEDDRRLNGVLLRGLTEQGHVVDASYDGEDGERCARGATYDAIVLDVNLPKRDGLSLLRELRKSRVRTPVLLLTSRDTPADIVEGLDAGADDYLRKPFVFSELEARLRSIVRRNAPDDILGSELQAGDLIFDLRTRSARRGTRAIELTARESGFLECFMRRRGQVVTRAALEDALFDRSSESLSNVIDVYVSRLRSKLTAAGESQVLFTVRGVGYRFDADD